LYVVMPGGGQSSSSSAPKEVEVVDPSAGKIEMYPLKVSGGIDFPWIVEGSEVVAIQTPSAGNSQLIEGVAWAFRPEDPSQPPLSLGPASDVLPAVTPGDVWLVSAPTGTTGFPPSGGPQGQGCTIREETITGRSVTPSFQMDCRRWLFSAVDGGLLSAPDVVGADRFRYSAQPDVGPSTNYRLQIWDPTNGRVIRTISSHTYEYLTSSDRYVEWESQSEGQDPLLGSAMPPDAGSQSVQITDVVTGKTRRLTIRAPKGLEIEDQPLLDPENPFVVYSFVTPQGAGKLSVDSSISECCSDPVVSVTGWIVIQNFITGQVVLDRRAPVSDSELDFTPNGSFITEATTPNQFSFVPAWSDTAPVKSSGITESAGDIEDAANAIVVDKPGSEGP